MAARELEVIIPARGGSKGIPGKNLRTIAGRPLLDWVVEACCQAPSVQRTVVSTDDAAIEEHVGLLIKTFGDRLVLHRRSSETATDTATTESVMLEWASSSTSASHVGLVQATSPLLTAADVEAVWRAAHEWDSVLTVVRQKRFSWDAADSGATSPDYDPRHRPRRQELGGRLVENGACYVTSREALLETGSRLSGRIGLVEMPEESYTELDEPSDVTVIEALLLKRLRDSRRAPAHPVRLVITDVDGVLTDNGMYYGSDGSETKRFSARDGKGFQLLREAGIKTAIITSERGELLEARARKLQVDALVMASADKYVDGLSVCEDLGVGLDQAVFIGDDVHDLGLLDAVGTSYCPSDAVDVVRERASQVLRTAGGRGAFREVADLVLGARDGAP